MQRYTQVDKRLFTADQCSLAFSGLMLPHAIVARLEAFGQGQLGGLLQFPQSWPATPGGPSADPLHRSEQAQRTPANKQEMRGGALRSRP